MKIVLTSDNHGRKDLLDFIVSKENADYYLHAGDSEMSQELINPFITVRGNRDHKSLPTFREINIDGVKIFLTHSHLYNFKELLKIAKLNKIDVVVYGHTHIYKAEQIDGIWFVNPGSLARPRGGNPKTYAVMSINNFDSKFNLDFKFEEI